MGIVLKLKKTALLIISGTAAIGITVLSKTVRNGVIDGLTLCTERVIPSLFLFTVVALFISYSGTGQVLGRLLSPLARVLWGLEGEVLTAWLISTISGYPVGSKLIGTLYKNGGITRAKALKTLTFSINAGPSFIITAVGVGSLDSASDGRRLLFSHLLATFIMAFAVKFLPDRLFSKSADNPTEKTFPKASALCVSDALVQSVSDAGRTMLTVCTFVVFFSGVGGMLSILPNGISNTAIQILEVTVGVQNCTRSQLPLVAFLLGFGGFSVIFQIKAAAGKLKPPLTMLILSRLIHGMISSCIIIVAEQICPRTITTGSFGNSPNNIGLHTSPFAAAALMLLCAVLLVFTQNSLKTRNSTVDS